MYTDPVTIIVVRTVSRKWHIEIQNVIHIWEGWHSDLLGRLDYCNFLCFMLVNEISSHNFRNFFSFGGLLFWSWCRDGLYRKTTNFILRKSNRQFVSHLLDELVTVRIDKENGLVLGPINIILKKNNNNNE